MSKEKPSPEAQEGIKKDSKAKKPKPEEHGGFEASGLPEPTRYGDWEVKGRCSDF